ncbi:hypothetical protein Bca101_044578 [Brassica carinata]
MTIGEDENPKKQSESYINPESIGRLYENTTKTSPSDDLARLNRRKHPQTE